MLRKVSVALRYKRINGKIAGLGSVRRGIRISGALGRRSLETLTRKCAGMAGSWLHGILSLINDKRLLPI
jgi:hypothetical protein